MGFEICLYLNYVLHCHHWQIRTDTTGVLQCSISALRSGYLRLLTLRPALLDNGLVSPPLVAVPLIVHTLPSNQPHVLPISGQQLLAMVCMDVFMAQLFTCLSCLVRHVYGKLKANGRNELMHEALQIIEINQGPDSTNIKSGAH